jgi:UDP-N-acetylglucosamine--N-acetylmuramyl-(pentapeptide) pyrophosphoryl-undecaprenol N-acetylglucosamine transferase
MGGSQGARFINETLLDALPELVSRYQIIHQTGVKNFDDVKIIADLNLKNSDFKDNYYPYPYLNKLALRMSAGVASLVVSRAGAGSIAEIASWGLPSIIIPITKTNGDHQRNNAFNYARTGACSVIEEVNLSPHVLLEEIDRILGDADIQAKMKEATKLFVHPDAEEKIAREIITIGLSHEH